MFFGRTYEKINLDAIKHNFDSVRNRLPNEVKILSVVKADAYGHGAVTIAKLLENKSDFFGVACVEEAMELKNAKIQNPILILGYTSPKQLSKVVENDIRISVFSYNVAKALSKEATKQGKIACFHFVVDTGMSRIGFQVTESDADICEKISKLPNIVPEGLFSHFATADEKDLSKAVQQRNKFKNFEQMLLNRGIEVPIKHLNNSAGIMAFDEHFDMVRSGIITYGMYPSEDVDKNILDIRPAMEWVSQVSHIKELEAGREISYGGTYTTKEKRLIATIPVGYADGYPRCLSNIGKVIINDQYANIVGRVCMDQFMVDITDIDGVKIENEVVLIGKRENTEITMEEISNLAHSFNYELPCRISMRVPKVYFENGKVVEVVNHLLGTTSVVDND